MKVTYERVDHKINRSHEYHHKINDRMYARSSYEGCVMFNSKGKPIAKLNYIPKCD